MSIRVHPWLKKGSGLLSVLCLLWPFLAACSKSNTTSSAVTASRQVLRISQRNEPADLDPALATLPDEFFIIRALSEGLVKPAAVSASATNTQPSTLNSQLSSPLPAAAASWEISRDGLTYTFHLRANAKWSNGDPVTSADFLFSYARLLSPATAAPKVAVFFPVKNAEAYNSGRVTDFSAVGFRAPDSLTLIVTLDHATPRFLDYAASGPWIPIHPGVVTRHERKWTLPENFVGNGPFALTEWRQQQRIVVRKNPHYHSAATVSLDEIQFIRFDSGDTEERAYRAGEVDVTMDVPRTKIAVYAAERPAELHRSPLAETRYLVLNSRPRSVNLPSLSALALVLDRQQLVDRVLLGGQRPAASILPETGDHFLRLANPPAVIRYDPDAARVALVQENSRRPLAPSGSSTTSRPLELSGWSQSQIPLLEAIQAMWKKELGVDVSLVIREAKVHLAALAAGDYDIALITLIPDVNDPAAILAQFTTNSPNNYSHWSNRYYDLSAEVASVAPDPAKRRLIELDAEGLLLSRGGVIPLYFNTKNFLMSPRVHGWREDPLWQRDYTSLSIEK